MFLWLRSHMKSLDKLKKEYFFLQKTYVYQTLQGADVWWGKSHKKVARSDHEITRGHLSNWKLISPLLQGLYHQPYQSADVWWQEATHGVTWIFGYAALLGHMKNLKRKFRFIWENSSTQKKFKIGIIENKLARKLILFGQSNLFWQSFLIQRLSHAKICNMILTKFQAMLQFCTY